jgi:hypothetical protein
MQMKRFTQGAGEKIEDKKTRRYRKVGRVLSP